jgi:hypothetical protein
MWRQLTNQEQCVSVPGLIEYFVLTLLPVYTSS